MSSVTAGARCFPLKLYNSRAHSVAMYYFKGHLSDAKNECQHSIARVGQSSSTLFSRLKSQPRLNDQAPQVPLQLRNNFTILIEETQLHEVAHPEILLFLLRILVSLLFKHCIDLILASTCSLLHPQDNHHASP
jgi:hypothetical protein